MNPIDMPSLDPEEYRMLNPRKSTHFLIGCIIMALLFVSLVEGLLLLRHPPVTKTNGLVSIDPENTHCDLDSALEQAGWKRVPHRKMDTIAADPRHRIILAQTLNCTDGEQSFVLREPWYEKQALPFRAQ